jgi:sugar (pentulose or hexulose) kinase
MIPKALWIARNEPHVFERAVTVCEYQDFMNLRLTGRRCASLNNMSIRWHYSKMRGGPARSLVEKLGVSSLLVSGPTASPGGRTSDGHFLSRGAFVGLTLAHGLPHLFRAAIEGICFGSRAIFDTIRTAGFTATEITVGGGATAPNLWLQIHADTSGLPVSAPESTEAPSLGCAVLAGVGAGLFSSIDEGIAAMVRRGRTIEPRARESAVYDDLYRRYAMLYPALKPITRQQTAH